MTITSARARSRMEAFGLSTDTKPTKNVPNGYCFIEMDTNKEYVFDAENETWIERTDSRTYQSLEIAKEPDITEYAEYDRLDLTGCVVKAVYSNGAKYDVTADATFNPADDAVLSTPGEVTVTASYSVSGTSKSATFKVTVAEAETP